MDDITAVMSAAGSERAALLGFSEGGAIASLFAATYPQQTSALVLYAANAKCTQTVDYPWGYTPEQAEAMFTGYIEEYWGSGEGVALLNPSVADDPEVKQWVARLERLGASPGAALALWRTDTAMDVRAVLPTIQAPTLIVHRGGDQFVDVGHGRYLAEHIAPRRRWRAEPAIGAGTITPLWIRTQGQRRPWPARGGCRAGSSKASSGSV
jgi:pimeloyl-ACP methyl ester carboxylesterase